ncbi:zinc-dependent metalloprotease [Photobacterium proteolyticum]|uniref:zinc-dependent metalloprotease n=1 Tax=Photobacterium proteolyticum TaxID=1903952 RepID=UPI000AB587A1|nr:zinc-dependent metalloprotease [Photobacterium proteolyticum]
MRKEKQILFRKLALVSAIATALAGCGADDQAYDTLPKPQEQIEKSQIKTDQVYLYMPSMGRAPKYAVSMSPFTQGQEKLVTLSYDANSDYASSGRLEVRELSPDVINQEQLDSGDLGRWVRDTDANAPIISLPGDFVDYQCAEDSYGDCINEEEQVDTDEVAWQERKYFRPEFQDVTIEERTWDDLFTFADGCITPVGSARLAVNSDTGWKGYEIAADGSINFELEQDYTVANNWSCMINALSQTDWNMGEMSFTASQFYSLVPLDLVRSKDYEPIIYRNGDDNAYGFFANSHTTTDVSYISGGFEQKFEYLHRFNPKSEALVYHLSDSFDENEDTKFFKQITIDAIAKINKQLVKVGVPPIRLVEPSGKQPGDLRYNVINLIDEPLSNGLAGYGPSAANPLTGEIVHAHVNQYSGVLRSISDWLWDNIVTDYNNDRIVHVLNSHAEDDTPDEGSAADSSGTETEVVSAVTEAMDLGSAQQDVNLDKVQEPEAEETLEQVLRAYQEVRNNGDESNAVYKMDLLKKLERRLWSENNMFPVSEMRLGATIKTMPSVIGGRSFDFQAPTLWKEGAVGEVGKLKKWDELDETVKAKLGIYLAGVYYGKTIVHELGHNLGLRHNFKGSNDANNYFTEEEAHEHGLKAVPGYTSIMDYNPSMLNALPVYGPYDLAALRFGYKRELETLTGVEVTAEDGTKSTSTQSQFENVAELDKSLYKALFDKENPLGADHEAYDGIVAAMEARLKSDSSKSLKEYKYCTDGNVSLNVDCNRHDEGRNVAEIIAYEQERYDDLYYTRTIRGSSANFDEDTISAYALRRIREFQDWRNVIHNYDRYTEFLTEEHSWLNNLGDRMYVAKGMSICNGEDVDHTSFSYEYFCSSAIAVNDVRNKLIDIILEPDHVCELKTTNSEGNDNYEYRKLAEIIGEWGNRNNFAINQVPESCFDDSVKDSVAPAVVTAEVGKYLNSGKAPRPAPVNNYSNYIDYLGQWGDKLAAAATLVDRVGTRSSTDRSDIALADLNGVTDDFYYTDPTKGLFDALILGKKLNFSFLDDQGNTVAPKGEFSGITWDDTLEQMPYQGSYSVRNYFGLPKYKEASLIKAILTAMVKHSAGNMSDQRDEVFARSITMRGEPGWQVDPLTYVRSNGKTYYAAADNTYAQAMIKFVRDFDALSAAEKSGADLTAVQLSVIALADYQDETKKALLAKQYAYQKQSLENLPVYNSTASLESDLLSH